MPLRKPGNDAEYSAEARKNSKIFPNFLVSPVVGKHALHGSSWLP
jgi:hypothetical protein